MIAEFYRCCEHCTLGPQHRQDRHRVPCAVMACGRIDASRQRVEISISKGEDS